MSEESSRHVLEQLGDAAFVERMKANLQAARAADFDRSPTERAAVTTNDENALRRLSGQDVADFNNPAVSHGVHAGPMYAPCAEPIVALPIQYAPIADGNILILRGNSPLGG